MPYYGPSIWLRLHLIIARSFKEVYEGCIGNILFTREIPSHVGALHIHGSSGVFQAHLDFITLVPAFLSLSPSLAYKETHSFTRSPTLQLYPSRSTNVSHFGRPGPSSHTPVLYSTPSRASTLLTLLTSLTRTLMLTLRPPTACSAEVVVVLK